MEHRIPLFAACAALTVLAPISAAPAQNVSSHSAARLKTVARFPGATPIGGVVSRTGRIFMSFPRAFDVGPYDVAEIKHGRPVPYPNAAINRLSALPQSKRLVSVQGLTVDAKDRLWLLDLGIIKTAPTSPGGPKLVAVDLATNKVVRTISSRARSPVRMRI